MGVLFFILFCEHKQSREREFPVILLKVVSAQQGMQ